MVNAQDFRLGQTATRMVLVSGSATICMCSNYDLCDTVARTRTRTFLSQKNVKYP